MLDLHFFDPRVTGPAILFCAVGFALSTFSLSRQVAKLKKPVPRMRQPAFTLLLLSAGISTVWFSSLIEQPQPGFALGGVLSTFMLIPSALSVLAIPILIASHEWIMLPMLSYLFGNDRIYRRRAAMGSIMVYGSFFFCLSCIPTVGYSMLLYLPLITLALLLGARSSQKHFRALEAAIPNG